MVIDSVPPPELPTEQQKADKKKKDRRRKLDYGLKLTAALSALALLVINIYLWKSTKAANEIAKSSFEIGQRPYITLGNKDGVFADIKETEDQDGWVNIIIHLQNSGRLPARVCVSTEGTAWPILGTARFGQSNMLMREKGKDSTGFMEIHGTACPTIGGESAYNYVIKEPFKQNIWNAIKSTKTSQIVISTYIQYCDQFGRYVCSHVILNYSLSAKTFEVVSDLDCSYLYGSVPNQPRSMWGSNEPLPPCAQPHEDEEYQKRQMEHWRTWRPKPTQ